MAALHYLDPLEKPQALISEDLKQNNVSTNGIQGETSTRWRTGNVSKDFDTGGKKGIIMPFQPLAMAFNNVSYYVDCFPFEYPFSLYSSEFLLNGG
ncbi:hypothetical protein SUGI_0333060 [Cryptomeria japonica]|nr:hypothetical protein SUGI_0333060 [Cryptomeria japonica]